MSRTARARPTITVFGLGEAGSRIAAGLASAGVPVQGFDPADRPTPSGVHRHVEPHAAVVGSSIVLAVTAGSDSLTALTQALDTIEPGTLYADLATSSAGRKRELARIAGARGLDFVDVALMSTVPGKGLATPALASGPGAGRYAAVLNPLGASCEVLAGEPGEAATRKLLRSVVMKGLAAVLIEALRGGEAADRSAWLWQNVVEELAAADEDFLSRLVLGTGPHAVRRRDEMIAASELLAELGVEPIMTAATVENLAGVPEDGLPAVPLAGDD